MLLIVLLACDCYSRCFMMVFHLFSYHVTGAWKFFVMLGGVCFRVVNLEVQTALRSLSWN